MFSSLAKLLQSVQTGSLKNILTGAGVMLGTVGVSMTAFNHAVDKFRNMSGSFSADLLALLHLSGMDIFFSSILGATATYITLQSGKLFLQKQQ
jgi:hypothetical protein